MQVPRAGQIALVLILGSVGLAWGCLVRVSIRQFPLLFLQGTSLLQNFGMSLVLSFWAPSVHVLWSSYLAQILLVSLCASQAVNLGQNAPGCVFRVTAAPPSPMQEAVLGLCWHMLHTQAG